MDSLGPPYLCVAARYQEIRWSLNDGCGRPVRQGLSSSPLVDFLRTCDFPYASLGVAVARDREVELEALSTLGLPPVRHCSWNDAALAGSLTGKPGVWLSMDHWIPLSGGCHSSDEEMPDHGGQVLALAREANHRTVGMVQAEASLGWLARQALVLATPAGGLKGFSLQRVSRALQPLAGLETSPQRSRQVFERVRELADFPGPEPACLALLSKTARRLSDLMRSFCARVRLSEPRAVWADGTLEGPLWNAMMAEFQRYLPDLRWCPPDHPPETGLLLLLLGEAKELERQALNPARCDAPPEPWAEISDGAWRQLSRGLVRLR